MSRNKRFLVALLTALGLSFVASAPLEGLSEIIIPQVFHFEPKSVTIQEVDEGKISEVVQLLNRMKVLPVKIRIEGHTDAFESKKDSVALSARRARAVFDRLVEAGIKPERLTAAGFGMERPIADNGKKEGRAANRRVEFQVLETDPPILDDCVDDRTTGKTVNKSKAIELAKAEFARTGHQVEDYRVTVDNDGSGKKWIVWFDAKGKLSVPGVKHAVTVEKNTGDVRFMPGE